MTTSPIRKKLTFISRSTPYGSGYAKACLDMVLSAAVFDQQVTLIFLDEGVLQLQKQQSPSSIKAKDISAALGALPLYDVEHIYADAESLALRGLRPDQLAINVNLCDAQQIATLIRQSDAVFVL